MYTLTPSDHAIAFPLAFTFAQSYNRAKYRRRNVAGANHDGSDDSNGYGFGSNIRYCLFDSKPIFQYERQEIIVLIVEPSRKLAHLVVALPVAVGTKSVEIPQSNTRGCRAPRLAKVRPQSSSAFACASVPENGI